MYIHVRETPGAYILLPYLDGRPLGNCYAVDDEAGIAWCHAERWNEAAGRWEMYRDPDDPDELARIEVRGTIELRRRTDFYEPYFVHLPVGDSDAWQAEIKAQRERAPDAG